MTEEQFWRANPRIIKVYEKAFKAKIKDQNSLIHTWVGSYGLSALVTAIDGCLNGRKARSKYMAEPVELFPQTEEDKARKKQIEIEKFMAWTKSMRTKLKGKEDKDG